MQWVVSWSNGTGVGGRRGGRAPGLDIARGAEPGESRPRRPHTPLEAGGSGQAKRGWKDSLGGLLGPVGAFIISQRLKPRGQQ